ncbi:MAG: hypothetical protein NTY71_01690 [Methanoregula sp.]|nr:hypothetical protein [Methanoregula sp.]
MKNFVGLDLGQAADFTAISVVEVHPTVYVKQIEERDPDYNRPKMRVEEVEGLPITYHVRHLERMPLGTPYPVIVERVREILRRLPEGTELIIDHTGVGRPVSDMFYQKGLAAACITIPGGDTISQDGLFFHVPKKDIVGVMRVAFENKELKIAAALPDAETLIAELLSFKVKISTSGHDQYEAWREGDHDDLVLSVGLAMWAAHYTYAQMETSGVVVYDNGSSEISPI